MFTIKYKGFYIHGYFDRANCRWHKPGETMHYSKSLHGAKCSITRELHK